MPTDFTDEADRVLRYVIGLKPFGAKEVTLVHVVDVARAVIWPLPPSFQEAVAGRMEERRRALEDEGFKVKTRLLEGDPSDEIIKLAADDNFSLIVTGSHGKRLLEEMLLGSVSEAIGRYAKPPVLLIRYDLLRELEAEQPLEEYAAGTFRKILFPTDFSPASQAALEFIKQLKKAGAQEVEALNVTDPRRIETEQEKHERVERCYVECGRTVVTLEEQGLKTRVRCRTGDPLAEILAAAREGQASLIVMGSHSVGLVKEWLSGSVSLSVVRTADRPALIVHEP